MTARVLSLALPLLLCAMATAPRSAAIDEHHGGSGHEHAGHDEHAGHHDHDQQREQGEHHEHAAPRDGDEAPGHHAGGADPHHAHAGEAFSVAVFERHGVRVGTAGPGMVDVGIDLPGEVRPNGDRIAHLAPRFLGIVREVRVQVGDVVAAGDVLAVIEGDNLVPFQLRAAFAGTVIDRHITLGEAVTRDRPAFIVVDLSTVWVDVAVHQGALARLFVGQPVVVTAGAGSPRAEGTISYVSPVVDQTTRTATARVVLPNLEGAWRPGQFVTATILEPIRAPVVVPRRALHTFEGARVVFAVVEDRFVPRQVTVGAIGRSLAELTHGLAAGERFADEGSFLVKADLAKSAAAHDH